ncbi:MAG: hypothetical protein WC279_13010 [Sulfurimonas sp.]|jgi:hypothetical protein|uniref:hypothetical protein n=1 Tax=Sulfurimonas sp. TaxID=2022749 RepID=UPI003562A35C
MMVPKKIAGKGGSFTEDCSRITPAGLYSSAAINAMGSSLYDTIREHMSSLSEFNTGGPGISGKILRVSGDTDGKAAATDCFLKFTDFNSITGSENIDVAHVNSAGTVITDALALFYGTGDRSMPATPYAYFSTNLSEGQESYVLIKHVMDSNSPRYTRQLSLVLQYVPDASYADVIEIFSGGSFSEIKECSAVTRKTLYTLKFGSNIKASGVIAALNSYTENGSAVFAASAQSAGTFSDEDMITLFDFYTGAVLTNTTVVLKFTGTCPGFILSSPADFFSKYFNTHSAVRRNVLSYGIISEVKRFLNPGVYGFLIRDSEKAGAELSSSLLTADDNYSFLYIPNRKNDDHLIPEGSGTGVPLWFSADNPLYTENHVSTVDLDTDFFFLPFCEVTDKSVEFMSGFSIDIDIIQEPEIANVSHPGGYRPEMKSSRVRHDIKTTTDTWYTQMSELFNKFKTHLSYAPETGLTENESILKRMSEFILGTAWYINNMVVIDPALSASKPAYPSINVFRTLQDAYAAGVLRPLTTVLFIGSNGDGTDIDNTRRDAVIDIDYDFMAKLKGIRFAAIAVVANHIYTAAETGFSLEGGSFDTSVTLMWHPDPATGLISELDFSGVYQTDLYIDLSDDESSDESIPDGWENIIMQRSLFNRLTISFVKTASGSPAYELRFSAGLSCRISMLEFPVIETLTMDSTSYYQTPVGYIETGTTDRLLPDEVISAGFIEKILLAQDDTDFITAGITVNPNFTRYSFAVTPLLCVLPGPGHYRDTLITYRQCVMPSGFSGGHSMTDRITNNIIVLEGEGGSVYGTGALSYVPAVFNLKLDIRAVSGTENRDKATITSLIHVDGIIKHSDIKITVLDKQTTETEGAITYAWNTFNKAGFLPGGTTVFPDTFLFLDCGLYATNTGSAGSWVTTRQGLLTDTRIRIIFDEDSAVDDWNRQLFFASDLFQKAPYIFYFGDLHPKWAFYNRKLSTKIHLSFDLPSVTDQDTLLTTETPLLLKHQWGSSGGVSYPILPSVAGSTEDTFNWQASKMFIAGLKESEVIIPVMRVIPVKAGEDAVYASPGSAEKYSSLNLFEDIPATVCRIGYLDCSYPTEGAVDYDGQDVFDGLTGYSWYGPGRGICLITSSYPVYPRLNLKAEIYVGRMRTRAERMACVGLEGGVVDVNYQFMTQANDSYIGDIGAYYLGGGVQSDPVAPLFAVMAFVDNRMSIKPYMPAGPGITGGFPMEASEGADVKVSLAAKLMDTLDSAVTPDLCPDIANSSLRPVILVLGFAPLHQIRGGSEEYLELSAINNKIYAHVTSVWQGISCYNTLTGFVYQRLGKDITAIGAATYLIQTNLNDAFSDPNYGLPIDTDYRIQQLQDVTTGGPSEEPVVDLIDQSYLTKLNILFMRIIRIKQTGEGLVGKLDYWLRPPT